MSNNLNRHQWQIGNIVLGAGTQYEVLGFKPGPYEVNAQDSQVMLSDEITMAQDSRKPGPITFTFGVRDNAPMPQFTNTLPADLVTKSSKLLDALQDEWYADEIKQQWGRYKALTYCDGYGRVKQVWGRPGKFDYTPKTKTSQWRKVTAEFRRLDTLCHAEIEAKTPLLVNGADPVYYGVGGPANSWFRVLFTGPQANPLVTIGGVEVQLELNITSGTVVEVSSYPWLRRIIDSNGINWRNALIGNTLYLDQLQMPKNTTVPITWTATSTSGATKCQVLWRDAYNVI